MTVERRIRTTTGILICFVVGTVVVLLWGSRQVDNGIKQTKIASEIVRSAFVLSRLMQEYLEHGGLHYARQWKAQHEVLTKALNDLRARSIDPEQLSNITSRLEAVDTLSGRFMEVGPTSAKENGHYDSRARNLLLGLMSLRLEQLLRSANDLNASTQAFMLERQYLVQQVIVVAGTLLVIIILINIYTIRKSVVRPLTELAKGAERIGQGNFDYVARHDSDDEVGRLGQAFNDMVDGIREQTAALKNAGSELQFLVDQRSAALEAATRYNRLLQTVESAQKQFITHPNPEDLFNQLVTDILNLTQSEFGFIAEALYTEDGQLYLKGHAITDISWDETSRRAYQQFAIDNGLEFHNIRGLWSAVILSEGPVIANDPEHDERRNGMPEGHPPLRSFLGLPFQVDGKVIGMAGIANRPGGYDQELVDFLQPYVSTCSAIIEAYRNDNRRKVAEEKLALSYAELEQRISERTVELQVANELLEKQIEERIQITENLRESEQQFRSIFENSLDAILFTSPPDGKVLIGNPAACRLFGYTQEEISGLTNYEFTDADGPALTGFLEEKLRTGKSRRQLIGRRKDGTTFPAEVSAATFLDAHGHERCALVISDITERKLAEEANKRAIETADILDKIFSSTHFCVAFLDRDFNFIRVNQAYADSCGFLPEFFPGKNHFDVFPHEENEAIFRHVVDTAETFTIYAKPFEFLNDPDRGTTYWDWTLQPVKDPSGRVAELIFILLEVTDRRLAEEQLRQSEQTLSTVLRVAPVGISLMTDGLVRLANEAFYSMTGYSPEEIIGRDGRSLYESDDEFDRVGAHQLAHILANHTATVEARWQRKDGPISDMLICSAAVDPEHLAAGVVSAALDITELKTTQELLRYRAEELARSNQQLEEFAYIASHDLQEPLRSVTACVQLLRKKYRDKLDAHADQLIAYSVDSAFRMKALIQDLLAYSRIDTRGKPFSPTNCEHVFDRCLRNLRTAISESGAVVTRDRLPVISADSTQLVQVFQNLIANSIKFRREGPPRIHVSVEKHAGGWAFSVRDNGIGIGPQYLERIFVLFQRLHRDDQFGGTGIGLAVVKKIVERHGGRITVESEPGVGTTFYFNIPDEETRI